jgi:hypothetical protein
MPTSTPGEADLDSAANALITPFRAHLDQCRELDLSQQLEECADYIQHIELLVSEFLESYYLVERLWEPTGELAGSEEGCEGELILEPFYESLELQVVDAGSEPGEAAGEKLVCISGAVSPLPGDQHPALSRRGLDFVGLRGGEPGHIVLGVAQSSKDETPFLLLLRALNALAELSPPLRVAQLGREIIRAGIPEDADFSLQIGLTEPGSSPEANALGQLTRDLAEAFIRQIGEDRQLSGTLGEISCVEVDPAQMAAGRLERLWRVAASPEHSESQDS